MSDRDAAYLLGGLVLLLIALALPPGGPSELEAKQAEYCVNWETWHADRRAGVPVDQRYGWPDVAGRYYEECE